MNITTHRNYTVTIHHTNPYHPNNTATVRITDTDLENENLTPDHYYNFIINKAAGKIFKQKIANVSPVHLNVISAKGALVALLTQRQHPIDVV